jgi:hypothetical protein
MCHSQPISPDFKAYLEDLVVTQQPCFIQFRSEGGEVLSFETRITDLYREEGEEYLMLNAGLRVLLNQVVDIDGFNFKTLS